MDLWKPGGARYLLTRVKYAKWSSTYRRSVVLCPWCCGPIEDRQGDLHHWLLKRGAVAPVYFDRINVPENLILVHHDCHLRFGQTRKMFERCRAEALSVYTAEELTAFYNGLSDIGVKPVDTVLTI